MMASLAHAAGRSSVTFSFSSCLILIVPRFVFDDYVWNPDGSTYSDYNGKLIPSRIPLTALVSGRFHHFPHHSIQL